MTKRHFDPLRPNRAFAVPDRYEFTHGTEAVCVYDIESMDFVVEIAVGPLPDCHATSADGRYLYIACTDGLYCINQADLEVEKKIETGPVFATNVMPDGSTMLLHDRVGGLQILKEIQDMDRIHVHKRLDVHGNNQRDYTLGGKGHFIDEGGRYYLCCGWSAPRLLLFDLENDCSWKTFIDDDPRLVRSDDLVISSDKTRAYCACHREDACNSYLAVIDIERRCITGQIETGFGTCGLTMTNDERYVVASNDRDDSISVIDTETDSVVSTPSARPGFDKLGIKGFIQGISVGESDEIYVYGCSGTGALVKFWDIVGEGKWMISYPGGKIDSTSL